MLFLGLLGLRIVTQFASQALIIYLGRRLLLQLTTRAFSSVMWHVPVSTIEKRSIGYFITLAGDEASRGSTVIVSLTQFTTTIALGGLYFLAIFSYSPLTAALVVAFLVFTFLALLNPFGTRIGLAPGKSSSRSPPAQYFSTPSMACVPFGRLVPRSL